MTGNVHKHRKIFSNEIKKIVFFLFHMVALLPLHSRNTEGLCRLCPWSYPFHIWHRGHIRPYNCRRRSHCHKGMPHWSNCTCRCWRILFRKYFPRNLQQRDSSKIFYVRKLKHWWHFVIDFLTCSTCWTGVPWGACACSRYMMTCRILPSYTQAFVFTRCTKESLGTF